MKERLAKLLTVKSLVTLVLTGVFAYLSIKGQVDQTFLTVYITIISFYFGTQYEKKSSDAVKAEEVQPRV